MIRRRRETVRFLRFQIRWNRFADDFFDARWVKLLTMMRSLFRCRYFLFWLLILSTIKLILVFYNDFQDPAIERHAPSNAKVEKAAAHSPSSSSPPETSSINRTLIDAQRRFVQQMNKEQTMYNREFFHPQRTRYILLVQVHTRVVYLRKFIEMLKSVKMIEQTLLVFSHDFLDPDINALVQNITFVPVGERFVSIVFHLRLLR